VRANTSVDGEVLANARIAVLPEVVRSREANAFAQLRAKPAPRCDALMSEAIASQLAE